MLLLLLSHVHVLGVQLLLCVVWGAAVLLEERTLLLSVVRQRAKGRTSR